MRMIHRMDTKHQAHIAKSFKQGLSVVDISRKLGVPLNEVVQSLPIEMPQHAISVRHIWDYWPQETFQQIIKAQHEHDAGMIDMCTGKTCNHFILYAIPRKQRDTKRRPWFTSQVY